MPARLTPRAAGITAGIVAGVVVVWVLGLVWFRPWIAHNDFAIFRIALERELDGHVRLVGAHSRLGVFHPGPLREWLFVVPYWVSGRSAAALPATSVVLNIGWIAWTLVVARRLRPPVWGASCALGLLLVVVALGADLGSPWNPHLAILPMYLACWSLVTVIARQGEGWVACVCSASFAAQLHASALVVAGGILAAALLALAVQRRREAWWALVSGLVLWSGPIADLAKGADANLVRLRTVGADGDSVGVGDAVGHISRLLWPGTPLGRVAVRPSTIEIAGFHRWWSVVVVGALVLVAVLAWRRSAESDAHAGAVDAAGAGDRDRDGGHDLDRLAIVAPVVACSVVAGGVLTVSMFVVPVYRYLYGPLQAAAVFVVAVLLGAVADAFAARSDRGVPHVRWVTVAIVPLAMSAVLLTVPREDGAAAERRALGVERAVGAALEQRPDWQQVEGVQVDFGGIGDLEAEVLDVTDRRGRDARSRRAELGLPTPDDIDGVFVVAMDPHRECLAVDAAAGDGQNASGVEEIIRGTSTAGEAFGVYAVDAGSPALARCDVGAAP